MATHEDGHIAEKDMAVDQIEQDVASIGLAKTHHGLSGMYAEAVERYPNDDHIDPEEERRLTRKLDMRIIPVLGICYFFYVSHSQCRNMLSW